MQLSKSIRISKEAYKRLVEIAARERRTVTAVVDAWLNVPPKVNGSVAGQAAGDLEVRRPEGTGGGLVRDGASAPVRLGQAASTQEGSVAEDVQGITDIAFPVLRRRLAETGSVAEKNESAARVDDSDLMHGIPAAVMSNDFTGPSSALSREDPIHEMNDTTLREVARARVDDASRPVDLTKPLTSPIAYERRGETRCGRCRVPWKNHQEGSRKNRAGTTGCTTFEDPS